MKALVTGSSSGIGKAIADILAQNNYEIIPFSSRLQDFKAVQEEVSDIKTPLDVLVLNAGFGIFEPLEQTSPDNIIKLISVNLTAPILLTSMLLRNLKQTKGHIVTISSIEALKHSKFSALYTASKTGLRAFSLSLFEEVRKSGVRVTNINPDITKSDFFSSLHFEPSEKEDSFLLPEDIANMVLECIKFKANVSEMTLRPQRFEIKKK